MKFKFILTSSLFLLFNATNLSALDAKGFTFSGGIFDTEESTSPVEFGLEYRLEPRKFNLPLLRKVPLTPAFGVSGTEDGNFWVYTGLRYDWEFSPKWYATPQFGISLYEDGDGKDLGGVIEFRSGLEISRQFQNGQRLGLLFYHLSNSSIYEPNPGSNSLVLTYSLGR